MTRFEFGFRSTFADAPMSVTAVVEAPTFARRAPDDPETDIEIVDAKIGGVSISVYDVMERDGRDGAITTLGNKLEEEAREWLAAHGEAA